MIREAWGKKSIFGSKTTTPTQSNNLDATSNMESEEEIRLINIGCEEPIRIGYIILIYAIITFFAFLGLTISFSVNCRH